VLPPTGDFRLGYSTRQQLQNPPLDMIRLAQKAINYLPEVPLYARVDMLFDEKRNTYLLIELEILDARLYLSNHSSFFTAMAKAVVQRITPNE
jgi:hypothetical protein